MCQLRVIYNKPNQRSCDEDSLDISMQVAASKKAIKPKPSSGEIFTSDNLQTQLQDFVDLRNIGFTDDDGYISTTIPFSYTKI